MRDLGENDRGTKGIRSMHRMYTIIKRWFDNHFKFCFLCYNTEKKKENESEDEIEIEMRGEDERE